MLLVKLIVIQLIFHDVPKHKKLANHIELTVLYTGGTCITGVCAASSVTAEGAVDKSTLISGATNIGQSDGAIAWTKCCTRLCCCVCK